MIVRDRREYDSGRVRSAVVNRLLGKGQRCVGVLVSGRVVVSIVAVKVRTVDVQPNTMARQERVRRWVHSDRILDDLARRD